MLFVSFHGTENREQVLVDSYESRNEINNTNIVVQRIADDGGNNDFSDAYAPMLDDEENVVKEAGNIICDVAFVPGRSGPCDDCPLSADSIMDGWLPEDYFRLGLGSSSIIGVTRSFSLPDGEI